MTGSFHSYKLFATVFMNYLIFKIVYYVTMWLNTLLLFTINKSNVLYSCWAYANLKIAYLKKIYMFCHVPS